LKKYQIFFDGIEKYPLTQKQREAIITNEDNNLVIAGAGSGKTSVIAARVSYLLEAKLCSPEDIFLKLEKLGVVDGFSQLVGTFLNHFKSNKRSVQELRETLHGIEDSAHLYAFLGLFQIIYDKYESALSSEGSIPHTNSRNRRCGFFTNTNF
jgi:hypothetical protein